MVSEVWTKNWVSTDSPFSFLITCFNDCIRTYYNSVTSKIDKLAKKEATS